MRSRAFASTVKLLCTLVFAIFAVAGAAQPALDKAGTDQKGDPLPFGALARMGSVRWRHDGPVVYVAYTPDGKLVLTAGRDNTIRLWDRATGKEIRRFHAKPTQPRVVPPAAMGMAGFPYDGAAGSPVALSRDGKVVAAIVNYAAIQLWNADTGKEIRRLDGPKAGVNVVVFSPDGKSLALRGADRTTYLLDTGTGKEIRQIKAKPAQGGGPLRFVLIGGPRPTEDGLAFSPDGKMLATAESEINMQKTHKYVKITDLQTGNEIRQIAAEAGVASIAFSPDGKVLAFGTGNRIHLHEADIGNEIRRIDNKASVDTLMFTHDSRTLAARGSDKVIRLFETSTGKCLHEIGVPLRTQAALGNQFFVSGIGGSPETRDIAFAGDNKTIAVGGTQTVRFWTVATGAEQMAAGGHRADVSTVLLTPDGKTMLSRGDDHVIRRWNARTGKELGQFAEPKGATTAAFAPDGRTLALANTDGTIRLLDTTDGKERHKIKGHANGLASLAFAPDGKTLASHGTADNIVRLFDVAKGRELKQLNGPVQKRPANDGGIIVLGGGGGAPGGQGLAFSPDGQTLAAFVGPNGNPEGEAQLVIWDLATGTRRRPISLTTQAVVHHLAYSPDGRLLAAYNADQTVTLWEIASGKERAVLGERQLVQRGGGGLMLAVPVNGFGNGALGSAPLAFSRDGTILASRGKGNTVRVWQIPHLKEIGLFKGHASAVNDVAFAADGKTLASASADTTLLVWDLAGLKREPIPANAVLEAKQIESLWADLAGTDAIKAGKSIQTLASAPNQTIPLLRDKLKPAVAVDTNTLHQWIADLDSGNFKTRSAAVVQLERVGDQAIPALRKVLATQSALETRRRVEAILMKLTTGVLSPEQLRLVRSIEVLENLRTAEAGQVLNALAQGAPGALPTRQAQAVLDRLPK